MKCIGIFYIRVLEGVGGANIQQMVRNIMCRIGTYTMWQNYNMTGRNNKRNLMLTGLSVVMLF